MYIGYIKTKILHCFWRYIVHLPTAHFAE